MNFCITSASSSVRVATLFTVMSGSDEIMLQVRCRRHLDSSTCAGPTSATVVARAISNFFMVIGGLSGRSSLGYLHLHAEPCDKLAWSRLAERRVCHRIGREV